MANTTPSRRNPRQNGPGDNAVRKRLFAFLADADGSIEEIHHVTRIRIGDLADWMVGIYTDSEDITGKIEKALDDAEAVTRLSSRPSTAQAQQVTHE